MGLFKGVLFMTKLKRKIILYSYIFLLFIIFVQWQLLGNVAKELHKANVNLSLAKAVFIKTNNALPIVNQTIKTNTANLEPYLDFGYIIAEGKSIMDKYSFIKTNEEYK